MARLALADLNLNSFPYTSHTTGSDALWAGCPIVTLAGTRFPSRVCGSLLTTIGVPELVTTNFDGYETLAVELAGNRERLDRIKQKIIQGRATSPLFDTQRFCRNLEKAYEEMIKSRRAGRDRPRSMCGPSGERETSAAAIPAPPAADVVSRGRLIDTPSVACLRNSAQFRGRRATSHH